MPSLFPMNNKPAVKSCSVCGKPRDERFRPFCSSRCRDRDLNSWFNEGYAVPSRMATPEELAGEE